MKKPLPALALSTGLLALTLAGCSGSTPDVPEQATAAAASAPASTSAEATPTPTPEPAPEGLYINPVSPAGEGEAEFILSWSPGQGQDPVPGTSENPTGIDFAEMEQNAERDNQQYAEVFTQDEAEMYAAEGMSRYVALRTDPMLFATNARSFKADAALLDDHRPGVDDGLLTDFEASFGSPETYRTSWILAGDNVEADGEKLLLSFESPHSITYSTPALNAWVDEGVRFLTLSFTETFSMGLQDGRIADFTNEQEVVLLVGKEGASIRGMHYNYDGTLDLTDQDDSK